jgi:hypothetical protein
MNMHPLKMRKKFFIALGAVLFAAAELSAQNFQIPDLSITTDDLRIEQRVDGAIIFLSGRSWGWAR